MYCLNIYNVKSNLFYFLRVRLKHFQNLLLFLYFTATNTSILLNRFSLIVFHKYVFLRLRVVNKRSGIAVVIGNVATISNSLKKIFG